MTTRGRAVFDAYVRRHLNHPIFGGLTIESHAFNVAAAAAEARIPIAEVMEEIEGSLVNALHRHREIRRQ